MEALQFSMEGLLAPNPITKRARRTQWHMKPSADGSERIVAYGVLKNLIIRDLNDWKKTKIYNNQVQSNVTCAKYSHDGQYIAYGDEAGGVRIIEWSAEKNEFVTKLDKSTGLLAAPVSDIAWTNDSPNKIVVVGGG